MRDIKFRGQIRMYGEKINLKGEKLPAIWAYGGIYQCPGERSVMYDNEKGKVSVYNETVGQYTGLKDKNGVDIYEGDLLNDSEEEGPVFVEWSNEISGFLFVDIFDCSGREEYRADQVHYKQFEVIGNIYEHPHLLKEAE